jgi:hypothetical protein
MRIAVFKLQDILKAFARKKVLTKKELLEQTGCSAMTAWRLLGKHGYFTSYNENASYYTLAGIPKFDEHGLWRYRKIRFSKWGSLTHSITGLIDESSAGLTAEQLEELLGIRNVKPSLTRLMKNKALTREKLEGRFVYFPAHRATAGRQKQQRKQMAQEAQAARAMPPLEHIIALLVEIIRRPKNTPRQWARRLAREGIEIGTGEIERVIKHYQIDEKKGLLNS